MARAMISSGFGVSVLLRPLQQDKYPANCNFLRTWHADIGLVPFLDSNVGARTD